jgi:hypothetical protein
MCSSRGLRCLHVWRTLRQSVFVAAAIEIFYEVVEFIAWAAPMVSEFHVAHLQSRAALYAEKIATKCRNAAENCVGFIVLRSRDHLEECNEPYIVVINGDLVLSSR